MAQFRRILFVRSLHTGIHNDIRHGKATILDAKAAESEEKNLVATEGYLPYQVFNCDEKAIFFLEN